LPSTGRVRRVTNRVCAVSTRGSSLLSRSGSMCCFERFPGLPKTSPAPRSVSTGRSRTRWRWRRSRTSQRDRARTFPPPEKPRASLVVVAAEVAAEVVAGLTARAWSLRHDPSGYPDPPSGSVSLSHLEPFECPTN
jgi:hypothetical protein